MKFNRHFRRGNRRRRAGLLAAVALLAGTGGVAHAWELLDLDVTRSGDTYHTQARFAVAAPPAQVFAVLTDYVALARLNPNIRYSAATAHAGATRVEVHLRECVLMYCKTLRLVSDMHDDGKQEITAAVVPGAGDLASGRAQWHIAPRADGTTVDYEATIEPAFWVPPVIGPYVVKGALRSQLELTIANLESLAGSDSAGSGSSSE